MLEVFEAYWDVYTDMWAFGWFCGLMFTCCLWCCLAHCCLQPCLTCMKKESKLDKSVFYNRGNKEPWNVIGAHRGGPHERLESTMTAFKHALKQGCNLMEVDVYPTKDNVIVISHDRGLGRLCGDKYSDTNIDETKFADLPPLQNEIRYGGEKGSYKQKHYDDGQWLKLEELFDEMPDTVFYSIDLKGSGTKQADQVYKLIKAAKLQKRVVWGSGNADVHARCKELDADIATYYPESSLINLHLWHLFGCLFCVPLEDNVLMQPIMTEEQIEREKFKRDRGGESWFSYA